MSFASRPAGAGGSQRLALAVIATSALMAVLDGSIVTVAMPSIQSHLGFSPAGRSEERRVGKECVP